MTVVNWASGASHCGGGGQRELREWWDKGRRGVHTVGEIGSFAKHRGWRTLCVKQGRRGGWRNRNKCGSQCAQLRLEEGRGKTRDAKCLYQPVAFSCSVQSKEGALACPVEWMSGNTQSAWAESELRTGKLAATAELTVPEPGERA